MAKKEKKPKDAEAPPVDGAEGGEGEAAPKKKFPLLIVIIAAAVLLGGGGAAAYFLFLAPKPPADAAKAGEHGKDEKAGHGEKKDAKKDKKRKRLHIETDHIMTDAPPVLHSGLTGGISKFVTRTHHERLECVAFI